MDDIRDIFIDVLNQAGGIDMAEAEFKKMIGADDELHRQYREWCQETGSSERMGFIDFCEEYLSERDEAWDSLNNDFNE